MSSERQRRDAAIKRLEAKRAFATHAAAFVIVNVGLVVIWALSGAGYFWPVWAIGGWGVGLAFNAWAVYAEQGIAEDDIRAEMDRQKPLQGSGARGEPKSTTEHEATP